ncbi:MAG: hypothetical protein AB2712_15480 [Candidatus Thiodiazotropha sp.]
MKEETLNFAIKKYELCFKNVEFLDSYVPKVLAIYAAFLGLLMVNLEKVLGGKNTVPFIIAFIVIITITVLLLLKRISHLVDHQKKTVETLEQKFQIEHDLSLVNRALPPS